MALNFSDLVVPRLLPMCLLHASNESCLTVRDWYAGTRAAANAVLSFIGRFRSVYPVVRRHGGPHDDLVGAMPDKGWHLAHQKDWLARVFNLKSALKARGFSEHEAALG
jgi:predicted acetyltransferase